MILTTNKDGCKWLNEAIKELNKCRKEAIKEGVEVPSKTAFRKARKVIQCLSEFEEEQPDIYPMEGVEGGDIIIDLHSLDIENSIFMLVESSGSGVLFLQVDQKQEYERIDNAENLPALLKRIRRSTVRAVEDRDV